VGKGISGIEILLVYHFNRVSSPFSGVVRRVGLG